MGSNILAPQPNAAHRITRIMLVWPWHKLTLYKFVLCVCVWFCAWISMCASSARRHRILCFMTLLLILLLQLLYTLLLLFFFWLLALATHRHIETCAWQFIGDIKRRGIAATLLSRCNNVPCPREHTQGLWTFKNMLWCVVTTAMSVCVILRENKLLRFKLTCFHNILLPCRHETARICVTHWPWPRCDLNTNRTNIQNHHILHIIVFCWCGERVMVLCLTN